jgi:hypothetical protein
MGVYIIVGGNLNCSQAARTGKAPLKLAAA